MYHNLMVALACAISLAAAELPAFEVATVKPASEEQMRLPAGSTEFALFAGRPLGKDGQRAQFIAVTLSALLRYAFELNPGQVTGPGWMDTERFTITAIAPIGTDAAGVGRMLQALLIERFEITYRRETKKLPVYLLTVAKGGHKLLPAEQGPTDPDDVRARAQKGMAKMQARMQSGDLTAHSGFTLDTATVAKFAESLARSIGRPVRDATQLPGEYSFQVEYVPEGAQPKGENGSTGPYLREAVEEQLGLHLQSVEESVDTLVVEKANKTPVSN